MKPYYEDDLVTLYHGDCREVTAWLEADALVTDPPYGISYSPFGVNGSSIMGEISTSRSATREIPEAHVAARNDALALWGDRPALVFGSWRAPRPRRTMMRLIWDKGAIGMGGCGVWRPADEEIYLLSWPNPKLKYGADQPSVIRFQNAHVDGRPDHPTPKPLGLMEYLIDRTPGESVADPFAGSGSTLIAAKALGRRCIGVEIDERYCEISARRLAQDTLFGGVA